MSGSLEATPDCEWSDSDQEGEQILNDLDKICSCGEIQGEYFFNKHQEIVKPHELRRSFTSITCVNPGIGWLSVEVRVPLLCGCNSTWSTVVRDVVRNFGNLQTASYNSQHITFTAFLLVGVTLESYVNWLSQKFESYELLEVEKLW